MRNRIGIALIAAVFALPLSGCQEEGAMEKAGKKMDEAAEEMVEGGEEALEEAGRKMDEAIDEMEDELED